MSNTEDYSLEYKRAIATLAERLKDSNFIEKVDLPQLLEDSIFPWDALVHQFPQARKIARAVEAELNYELSINQCCNALNWLNKCDPQEWQYLLITRVRSQLPRKG